MAEYIIDLELGLAATSPNNGRQLLSVFDSETIRIAGIVLGAVIGVCLLGLVLWAITTKCGRKRSAPVNPEWQPAATKEEGDLERGLPNQAANQAAATAVKSAPPVPPWAGDHPRLPPGIILTPITPPMYQVIHSKRAEERPSSYERLVLISSRVHNAEAVAQAVRDEVAHILYDWKNFTLPELLLYVQKVLGSQKVTSIAVIAPGSKPGGVGLLEGSGTTADKLATKQDLAQFWRVLAGFLTPSGTADDSRIHLIGCRVLEASTEGAALLKELETLTGVRFAAADDVLGGYMLQTWQEDPVSRQLSLKRGSVSAKDLYFNQQALRAAEQAGGAGASAVAGLGMASAGAPGSMPWQFVPSPPSAVTQGRALDRTETGPPMADQPGSQQSMVQQAGAAAGAAAVMPETAAAAGQAAAAHGQAFQSQTQAMLGQAQAAARQEALAAEGQAQTSAQDTADLAAQSAQERAAAAMGSWPPLSQRPLPPLSTSPLLASGLPGGQLAPLMPRPGALPPLAPLPAR